MVVKESALKPKVQVKHDKTPRLLGKVTITAQNGTKIGEWYTEFIGKNIKINYQNNGYVSFYRCDSWHMNIRPGKAIITHEVISESDIKLVPCKKKTKNIRALFQFILRVLVD